MAGLADKVSCRQVLNLMVILGFMFNYMLRVNLTIAIVEMVVQKNDTAGSAVTVESTGERYHWDEKDQALLHGSFFWGYVLTELPGGRLAEVVGARRVFGYSMLGASVVTLLTPYAAHFSHMAVVVLRVILGFMLGATWPAMHPMAAAWIPPNERSKFVANMMASSLGAAITMPICGFLIDSMGWPSVFYATGIVGVLWSISWFFLVFDSPAQHPRITVEERTYIENAIGASGNQKNKPDRFPWLAILSSAPVWAIVLTHGCSVFGYFTIVNQLPTYMKQILNFNIKANGLLSSLPYLGKYLFAVLTSALADHLLSTGRLTTTQTRKIFTTFAVLTPGLLMVAQVYLGQNAVWSVVIFTSALTVNGAVTAGYLGNGLDIAPNFSGTIFGMANTLSSSGGFLSAAMVGIFTFENHTYGQWQKVFWVLVAVYSVGATFFLVLGSGELQPWNNGPPKALTNGKSVDTKDIKHADETIPLNEKV